MCRQDLKTHLLNANSTHDKDSLEFILNKFYPLIKKCAGQLSYVEAMTDLNIFLIEFIYKLDPKKIAPYSEGELVNYIAAAIKNKKIDLYRKSRLKVDEVYVENMPDSSAFENEVCFYGILLELPERQRYVFCERYIKGYSDAEIAKKLNLSRQAVHKLRLKAVETLLIVISER